MKISKLVMIGVAAMAAIPVAVGLNPAAAHAGTTSVSIKQAGTTLCLALPLTVNAQIRTAVCNSSDTTQRWTEFTDFDSGIKFVNQRFPTLCLAVHNSLTIAGAPVEGEGCSQDPNQDWFPVNADVPNDGVLLLENLNSHLCLQNISTFGGQETCALTLAAQRFLLVP